MRCSPVMPPDRATPAVGLVKCTVSDRGYNRQYDIPGSSRPATSNTECAEVCQKTRGCNLAVYVPTVARCYPKTVPVPQPGSTFQKDVYIVIPDGSDLPCGAYSDTR